MLLRRLALFALLFVWYQAPEGLARLGTPMALWGSVMLLFLPAAWLAGRALGFRPGFAAYALQLQGRWAWVLALSLLLALAARGLALLAGEALGILALGPLAQRPAAGALALGVAGALLTTLVPSLAEDLLTRGFWYRAWPLAGQGLRFVLFSALLYVLNHVYRLHLGPREWLMLLCMGLAFGAALARTGTLWAALGLHWGWNLSSALFDLALDTQVLRPEARPLLSAATALLLLALVPLLPRSPRPAPTPPGR